MEYYYIVLLIIVIIIVIIIIIIMIYQSNSIPGELIEFDKLSIEKKAELNIKLKDFEEKLRHWYPLGDDCFNITHGDNYYAFFERLGDLHMSILMEDKEVIGTAFGVLRKLKEPVWYLCDLKLDRKHRGKQIPFKMLKSAFNKYNLSNKIYGISMNKDNEENRIVKLANNIPLIKFSLACKLMIYSINYEELSMIQDIIIKYRGPISFLSLHNIKDLILKSTGKHMPILHIQWGTHEQNSSLKPEPNYTYMFCCPEDDHLYHELNKMGITTNTTASIIHHNMEDYDWKFILTSDI